MLNSIAPLFAEGGTYVQHHRLQSGTLLTAFFQKKAEKRGFVMEKLIMLPVIMVCLTRTVNYGIYTMHDRNRTGAMSLFALASLAALASVYFLMR